MTRPALLSPARYLRSGYGLALPDNFSLSTLRTTIARAQSQVDRYVGAPQIPQPFDWRGGAMTDEPHQWKIVNPLAYGPGARRVYTNAGPIRTVTAFRLDLGKTYQVDVNANDLYINAVEQYVEIVAVNPTITGMYPLNINLGLYSPVARISYTYGWNFPVSGDILEAETSYVFSASYGNWDESVDPVIEIDGIEVDPGDYAIDFDNGVVTFDDAPAPGGQVSASYSYSVPSAIVDALGYTVTSMLGQTRMAGRGMVGLSSLRVAEVSLTAAQGGAWAQRNGVSLPIEAAALLSGFSFASVAA